MTTGVEIGIEAEGAEVCAGCAHVAAGGDRPGEIGVRQCLEQLDRPGQGQDFARERQVKFRVPVAQALDGALVDLTAKLAEQLVGEQAAAHPDLAVDPPDRELEPVLAQRQVPGADVLVDAVDEGAVEVEEKGDGVGHGWGIGEKASGSPAASCHLDYDDIADVQMQILALEVADLGEAVPIRDVNTPRVVAFDEAVELEPANSCG